MLGRYRGVSTHKQSGKWVAQIKSGGKQVYLGFYADQVDAARAYDQAVIHMQASPKSLSTYPLIHTGGPFKPGPSSTTTPPFSLGLHCPVQNP